MIAPPLRADGAAALNGDHEQPRRQVPQAEPKRWYAPRSLKRLTCRLNTRCTADPTRAPRLNSCPVSIIQSSCPCTSVARKDREETHPDSVVWACVHRRYNCLVHTEGLGTQRRHHLPPLSENGSRIPRCAPCGRRPFYRQCFTVLAPKDSPRCPVSFGRSSGFFCYLQRHRFAVKRHRVGVPRVQEPPSTSGRSRTPRDRPSRLLNSRIRSWWWVTRG